MKESLIQIKKSVLILFNNKNIRIKGILRVSFHIILKNFLKMH